MLGEKIPQGGRAGKESLEIEVNNTVLTNLWFNKRDTP